MVGHPLQGGVGDQHVDAASRARPRRAGRRRRSATSGDVAARPPRSSPGWSRPRHAAPGQRSASSAVRLPGPQPRSTTVRGVGGADPGEQVDERPAALVGVGQVAVGVPGVASPPHVSTSRYLTSGTQFLMSRFLTVATLPPMRDEVDELVEAWARERPDLDLGAGRGLQPDQPARPPPRPGPRDAFTAPRHRVVGVRRAGRAAPGRRAVRALARPAAARDAGDQRHHDQPGRPARRARVRRAAPPTRPTAAACWSGSPRRASAPSTARSRRCSPPSATLLADLPAQRPRPGSPPCCARCSRRSPTEPAHSEQLGGLEPLQSRAPRARRRARRARRASSASRS